MPLNMPGFQTWQAPKNIKLSKKEHIQFIQVIKSSAINGLKLIIMFILKSNELKTKS